jgi:hypothetical protein
MHKRIVAASLAALLSTPLPAFAQSREFGCVFPLIYDAQGLRHFYTYLYYGALTPPLASEKVVAKVAHSNHARGTSRLNHGAQPQAILVRNKHPAALSKDTE